MRSALQPRLNVGVALAPGWKAKVAVGRFSQELFTVTNENDIMPIFIPWIGVPRDLEAEWADHYVVGLEGKPVVGLLVNTQAYYKRYGSLVTYNRDKIEDTEPDYINAKAEAYGGELLVRYDHELVNLYLAYTLGKVNINQNGFVYAPRYDRRHTLNLLCTIHPWTDLDVSLRWEFGSGLPFTQITGFYDRVALGRGYPSLIYRTTGTPVMLYGEKNSVRLPSYHRLDASVQYRFMVFSGLTGSVGASGVNLYDRRNLFYFEQTTGRRVDMLGFLPSASLNLSYAF
jgi:hypothetical protein